jgi:two-component system sensor histidine kinase YesM
MKWYGQFSFKTRVFLGCLLVALVPLTFSSVVVTRLFTASINRQLAVEGKPAAGGGKRKADPAI